MEYIIYVIISLLCGDRLGLEASWPLRGPLQRLSEHNYAGLVCVVGGAYH